VHARTPLLSWLRLDVDAIEQVIESTPGTSKWNKVEHRLFSFISMNWRGRPLRSYETIVSLISNTTNRGGLVVRARLDRRRYPTGKKISKKEFRELKIEPDSFHGDWNYVISRARSDVDRSTSGFAGPQRSLSKKRLFPPPLAAHGQSGPDAPAPSLARLGRFPVARDADHRRPSLSLPSTLVQRAQWPSMSIGATRRT